MLYTLSNLSSGSIRIDANLNRILGFVDASDSPQVNAIDVLASYREELAKMTERALIAEVLAKSLEGQVQSLQARTATQED